MNYNIIVFVSLIICVIISFALSLFITSLVLDESSNLFKIIQLLLAITTMTTIYAPIKSILLKYTNIKEFEDENKNS